MHPRLHRVSEPGGGTKAGFQLGLSGGFYLDPNALRTRLAFSGGIDKNWSSEPYNLKRASAQWRIDYAIDPVPDDEYDPAGTRRATVIVMTPAGGDIRPAPDPLPADARSSVFGIFAGYTQELVQQPNKVWRNTISWSLGPTYAQWTGGLGDGTKTYGLEGHFTFAFSPLTWLHILGESGKTVVQAAHDSTDK